MAYGEGGGSNFAGTGGYGGQFGGFGGAGAGYTGGYGNPSSVGGGTAGQTYSGQPYANTLNKYNPSLPNYSGGATLSGNKMAGGAVTPEWLAEQLKKKAVAPTVTPPPKPPVFSGTKPPIPQPAPPHSGFTNYQNWVEGTNLGGYPGAYPGGDTPPDNSQSVHIGEVNWGGNTGALPGAAGRQFGGPVAPGGQYTVGENGPETLQMGPGGGGQVIPHNPMDRLGSMNPQMMQQMFQLMRQHAMKKQAPAQQGMQPPPMPVRNPTPPMAAPPQPPQGGGFQGRPMPPPMQGGFGLSHLGQSGVLGQIRNRPGFGGGVG